MYGPLLLNITIMDALSVTDADIAFHDHPFTLLLSMLHGELQFPILFDIHLVFGEFDTSLQKRIESLQFWHFTIDLEKFLVDGIDPIGQRVLDSLLEDDLNVIPHENVDDLEVLSKPDQDRPYDRLDQQLVLGQLKYPLLEDKTDPEKLHNLHDRYPTETRHLLKLVLRIDCFDVEPIGDVALEEVVVVAEDVHQDDGLFVERGLQGSHVGLRHDHPRVALVDVIDQQEHRQQFVRLLDLGNALVQFPHIHVSPLHIERVKFLHLLINRARLELPIDDFLCEVVHVDVVEVVEEFVHFSTRLQNYYTGISLNWVYSIGPAIKLIGPDMGSDGEI